MCGRSCVWLGQDGLQFLDNLSFLDGCVHVRSFVRCLFRWRTGRRSLAYMRTIRLFSLPTAEVGIAGVCILVLLPMLPPFFRWPVLVIPAGRQVVQCGEKSFRAITRFQLFFHCCACCFQICDGFCGCVCVVYGYQFAGCFCSCDVQRTFV